MRAGFGAATLLSLQCGSATQDATIQGAAPDADASTSPAHTAKPTPDAGMPALPLDAGTAGTAGTAGAGNMDAGAPTSSTLDAGGAREASGDAAGDADAQTDATASDAGSGIDTGEGVGGSGERDGKWFAFIEMKDIPSGAEAHRCVVVELPNSQPVWVSSLHAHLDDGSHHLIVDRYAANDVPRTKAYECSPTMAGDATRLLIAQQRDTTLTLPTSVGYHLEAHQRVFLQLHYINVTAAPLTIRGEVELSPLPNDAQPIEARSVFTGSTAISLPPREATSVSHFQTFPADPAWHVFAMTSHTHQLGVRATIERVADGDAPETEPLHESLDWAEPPLTVFESPLEFRGDDGLRLTCRYMNTTDHTVQFGVGVDDEMCFMWLYYYLNDTP